MSLPSGEEAGISGPACPERLARLLAAPVTLPQQ